MRRSILFALVALAASAASARAQAPASPLALVPQDAELLLHVAEPKKVVDAVYGHELFPEAQKIQFVQDLLESTNARRYLQLVAYFEKQLGCDRMELIDKLAGGGLVVAGRVTQPPRALLIAQAKDADLLKRFVKLSREVFEQEISRQQEGKVKLQTGTYKGAETLNLDRFHIAVAGSFLIATNDRKTLEQAVDLSVTGKGKSILENRRFVEASKQKPASPLLWGWTDWEEVKKLPAVKNAIDPLGGDPITFLIFGGAADVVRRSPWIAASLAQEGRNFRFAVQMPRGRDGMPPQAAAFFAKEEKSTLPLLKPARTIYSISYFLDIAQFWDNRAKFLNKEDLANLDKGEKFIAPFLGGKTLAEVFKKLGPYQRFVATQPKSGGVGYKNALGVGGNSAAVVLDLRDQSLGKSLSTALRSAALAGAFTLGLRMKEEEYRGYKLVSYSFNEKQKVANDPDNLRLMFSPCFCQVGSQFMVSSTYELGKELIDLLDKEDRSGMHVATTRLEALAEGGAESLKAGEDPLVSSLVLSQGFSVAAARKEFSALVNLVRRLGRVETEVQYGSNNFRFDLLWRYKN